MKRFLILFKLEYGRIFAPLLILIAVMAVLQTVLFTWRFTRASGIGSLSFFIESAGVHIVFAFAFMCLLALVATSLAMNYMPSKSMYALLTLPVKRSHVYLSKLSAALIAGFMLISAQMLLLLLFSLFMRIPVTCVPFLRDRFTDDFELIRRSADLYLSLLDVGFLRILFPPNVFSLMFSIAGLFGSLCVTLYFVTKIISGGNKIEAIIAVAFWLGLLLVTFPLHDGSLGRNVFCLIMMAALSIVSCFEGIKYFVSGEVAP